jgi:hypothetical protein
VSHHHGKEKSEEEVNFQVPALPFFFFLFGLFLFANDRACVVGRVVCGVCGVCGDRSPMLVPVTVE